MPKTAVLLESCRHNCCCFSS